MSSQRASQPVRRILGPLVRPLRTPRRLLPPPYRRPEFPQVNRVAGTEPLHPELSGLQLRHPVVPRAVTILQIPLSYRWRPSTEHVRRQVEACEANRWVHDHLRDRRLPPPILTYPEDQDVVPTRVQPLTLTRGQVDLRDLEAAARPRLTWDIHPQLPEIDHETLEEEGHVLPRRFRRFLRHSPYPRAAVGILAGLLLGLGGLWTLQMRQAEVAAAAHAQAARLAFRSDLDAARRYGVAKRDLWPLESRARALGTLGAPSSFIPSGAHLRQYRSQAHSWAVLRRQVRQLERRTMSYWTEREGVTYASLLDAHDALRKLGVTMRMPDMPACAAPGCFRRAVARQMALATRWRTTAAALSPTNKKRFRL